MGHPPIDQLVELLCGTWDAGRGFRRDPGKVEDAPPVPDFHDELVATRHELDLVAGSRAERLAERPCSGLSS